MQTRRYDGFVVTKDAEGIRVHPRDDGVFRQVFDQAAGDGFQHGVAVAVAERVIDV